MTRSSKNHRSGKILASAVLAVASASAIAGGQVNLLTWEGYADKSFIKPFEQQTGCKVTATYVGSNDDFAPKMAAGGGVYDLISPSIDTVKIMIEGGFVEPVDLGKIPEWKNLYSKFRDAKGIHKADRIYGVPYAWGAISFMYRTDKIANPPTSLKDLWDQKYAGHISLWDDKSAVYVAARLNGDSNIYSLSDAQLERAKKTLIAQKPMIRKYWATAGELVDLYASGEVWISNTWGGYQSSLLAQQNIPVKEFIPKEKAEGWMDSWMIVKGTPNKECAYKFINMSISEAGQCGVANVNGYSATNKAAAKQCMTPDQFKALHQDNLAYLDSLLLWENLGDRLEVYTNTWNAVKAAN